ncbi:MAG: sugar phosphate nucleotidyltransferase [Acidianus infernus]|nr:sugar phosphate nucleotidyltransferase [Acidianus infernus]
MSNRMNNLQVIMTAAGYATRFIPWSYITPKEMLPIYNGSFFVPAIQYVFEQLYDLGLRDFIIVVRKNKHIIMNHFSPDWSYVEMLSKKEKYKEAEALASFFKKVEDSRIEFVVQKYEGFGGAVLSAKDAVKSDKVFIVAPDMILDLKYIPNPNTILVSHSYEPQKYGVVQIDKDLKVVGIFEKPSDPVSNIIFLGYAVLSTRIFDYLKLVKPDNHGEIQLTTAIHSFALNYVVNVAFVDKWFDVGNPESYLNYFKNLVT